MLLKKNKDGDNNTDNKNDVCISHIDEANKTGASNNNINKKNSTTGIFCITSTIASTFVNAIYIAIIAYIVDAISVTNAINTINTTNIATAANTTNLTSTISTTSVTSITNRYKKVRANTGNYHNIGNIIDSNIDGNICYLKKLEIHILIFYLER